MRWLKNKAGGPAPKQTGTTQKRPAQPGGADANPVKPNPGFDKKKK
jgi:hypothetical protein